MLLEIRLLLLVAFIYPSTSLAILQCEQSSDVTVSTTQSDTELNVVSPPVDIPVRFERQALAPATPEDEQYFGDNVSLNGDWLAVSQYNGPSGGEDIINLFSLEEGSWARKKSLASPGAEMAMGENVLATTSWLDGSVKLFGSDQEGVGNWGFLSSINRVDPSLPVFDGTRLVFRSAENQTTSGGSTQGVLYVFEHDSVDAITWSQSARLEVPSTLSGNTRLFNPPETKNGQITSAAYIDFPDGPLLLSWNFNSGSNQWTELEPITFSDGCRPVRHASDGNTLVVNLRGETPDGRVSALVFFERNDTGEWQKSYELDTSEYLWDLEVEGDVLVAGAVREDVIGYVFRRHSDDSGWEFSEKLMSSEQLNGEAGPAVSMDDGRVAIGVWGAGPIGSSNRGTAFIFEIEDTGINAGHAGAWFNPDTAGQGQLIDIEPASQFMFLAWFAYTEAGSENPNQQHWLTAQGNYSGDSATLPVYETLGGKFDDPQAVSSTAIGTLEVNFSDCASGQAHYIIESWGVTGSFPLSRAIPGSENVCSGLAVADHSDLVENDGWDGAWYDPETAGQGFLIDVQPNPDADDFIFIAWFTYGDTNASGQRWLTAQGPMNGAQANIAVYETTGGSFDDPTTVSSEQIGTMNIEFNNCNSASLTYDLINESLSGTIDIVRAVPGTEALCEKLANVN